MGRSSNVSSSIDSNSVLLISRGSSWPYGCIPTSIIASVSDEVFNKGGGPAGGRGCCTSSTGLGTSRTTTSPKTSRELFEAEKPSLTRFCRHLNKCAQLQPSHIQLCILVIPDLASSASRVVLSVSLERDFHHALPPEHVTSLSVLLIVPPP